ncbi:MAG: hypothetical protein ACREHV_08510, partial [Rhizomicrobium sp.]
GSTRITKSALYMYGRWKDEREKQVFMSYKYVSSTDKSTLECAAGYPDLATWIWIYDIQQNNDDVDVIFGVASASPRSLSIKVGNDPPVQLFAFTPGGVPETLLISTCFIPDTPNSYAIIHRLGPAEAMLYTNYGGKDPTHGFKLMCDKIQIYPLLRLEANRDYLIISLDTCYSYQLSLTALPNDYNTPITPPKLSKDLTDFFYLDLEDKKLHFNDATSNELTGDEINNIHQIFGSYKIGGKKRYFLTFSKTFITYPSPHKTISFFSMENGSIVTTFFSSPTPVRLMMKKPYSFLCWLERQGDGTEKIYLFIPSSGYLNHIMLVFVNYVFSIVVPT